MKNLFYVIIILLFSRGTRAQDSADFFDWLNQHKEHFIQCVPTKEGENYRLCDNTQINQVFLKRLFKKTTQELYDHIKNENIQIIIYCQKDLKGIFDNYCTSEPNKLDKLHGKFLPEENTILLQSNSTRGDLIHEYIHSLQYKNSNVIFGRRYKAQRVIIQKSLVEKMDQAIEKSKLTKTKKEIAPLIQIVKDASSQMVQFSYWQDLIDERSIFLLYLIYGHEFNLPLEDLNLARKNMGFICKREKLPTTQCGPDETSSNKYLEEIFALLKEIRPKVNENLINNFVDNTPKIDPNLSLEKKVSILSDYIFKHYKITPDTSYRSIDHLDNILPDSALKNKKAHCLGLSILYLLLAEKTRLNAYLVRAPSHVFIRFCEKTKCLNVETLKQGEIVKDSYFIENLFITENSQKNGIYLQNLDSVKELFASIYLGLGYIAGSNQQNELAEFFYKKAIDNSRGFADAYSNLSAVYAAQGKMNQAKAYSEIALKINPDFTPAMINLGAYHQNGKDVKKAIMFYDRAIKLNPVALEAYRRRAKLNKDLGNTKEAALDLERILIINPNFCDVLEESIQISTDSLKIKKKKQNFTQLNLADKCIYLSI